MDDPVTKKKIKWLPFAVVALVVLVIGLVIWFVIPSGKKQRTYDEQIALAERYLEELDYDKAIAAYKKAMEIDPDRPEAYKGIVDVYLAKADAAADDERALEILDEAMLELDQLQQAGNSIGSAEEYRVLVREARLKYLGPEQSAQKEETAEEDDTEDENGVTPTSSPKEVTPTEKAAPTEAVSPTPEAEEVVENEKPSSEDEIENLIIKHYQQKYFCQVGIATDNGRRRIEGNMMNVTIVLLDPEGVSDVLDVSVNMDTGLCTDSWGESANLW